MNETVGAVVRQGPQKDGVDDAEDCDVGADTERERQDPGGREARVAHERADREAQVVCGLMNPQDECGSHRQSSVSAWVSVRSLATCLQDGGCAAYHRSFALFNPHRAFCGRRPCVPRGTRLLPNDASHPPVGCTNSRW
jgi:hypothetical protein